MVDREVDPDLDASRGRGRADVRIVTHVGCCQLGTLTATQRVAGRPVLAELAVKGRGPG